MDNRLVGIPKRYHTFHYRRSEGIDVPYKWRRVGGSNDGNGNYTSTYEMNGVYWDKDGVLIG